MITAGSGGSSREIRRWREAAVGSHSEPEAAVTGPANGNAR